MNKTVLIISAHKRSLVNFRGNLISEIVGSGADVHVAAPDLAAEDAYTSRLVSFGASLHDLQGDRVSLNPINDLAYIRRLCSLIGKLKPDVVFCYNLKPSIYGMIASRIMGVKTRVSLMAGLGYGFSNGTSLKSKLSQLVSRILMRLSLRNSTKVVFQNPDDREKLVNYKIIKSTHPFSVVGGSGVDLEYYSFSEIPKEKISFVMLCRLLVSKGVRNYAEAAKELKKKYPDVEFILAGDLDTNPDAISETELDEWIHSGFINYVGRVNDVRPLLEGARAFVLPSYYPEGIPRSALEALAAGRPIVTTDWPGCRETATHGYNGFLVDPKSSRQLIESLEKLINDRQLAVEMGINSYWLAKSRFDVKKVNVDMLRALGLKC